MPGRSGGTDAPATSSAPAGRAAAAPGRAVPRTLTPPPERTPVEVPAWVTGVVAAAQGALLSLLAVALPALAAFVATSADPAVADVGWPQAVGVGATVWLMGHGAGAHVDGSTVTILPLGVTGLALFTTWAAARRSAQPDRLGWLAGTATYAAAVGLVALVVGRGGALAGDPAVVARAVVCTLLVGSVGLALGTVRPRRVRALTEPAWSRLPALVRTGGTAGVLAVLVLVAAAAVVTAGWVVARRAPAGDVIAGLGLDTFGGFLMGVAQLALAPNLVLWVLAWLVGPGFAVGEGTLYAPHEVVSGPLPALPMLAALPDSGLGATAGWVPVAVAAAGALAGSWLRRRLRTEAWWEPLALVGVAGAAAALTTAVLCVAAGGSAGPGRLAVVGPDPAVVGAVAGGLVLLGAFVVVVPASRAVRVAVAGGARGLWDRVRSRGAHGGDATHGGAGVQGTAGDGEAD